jgi:hypothetical protein
MNSHVESVISQCPAHASPPVEVDYLVKAAAFPRRPGAAKRAFHAKHRFSTKAILLDYPDSPPK